MIRYVHVNLASLPNSEMLLMKAKFAESFPNNTLSVNKKIDNTEALVKIIFASEEDATAFDARIAGLSWVISSDTTNTNYKALVNSTEWTGIV